MTDRRVHASCSAYEVVRYERAGKWFVERRNGIRLHVRVKEAAQRAVWAREDGGTVYFNVPGGSAFDRKVRALGPAEASP